MNPICVTGFRWLLVITPFLAATVGGYWLGMKGDEWLQAHPGPCLIGTPEECDAINDQQAPSLLPILGAVVGGALVLGATALLERAFRVEAGGAK